MNSSNNNTSDSHVELIQAEQRLRYLGLLPEKPGRLPSDAEKFIATYPLLEINTSKFFDLLSYLYDGEFEKYMYDDLLFVFDKARRKEM